MVEDLNKNYALMRKSHFSVVGCEGAHFPVRYANTSETREVWNRSRVSVGDRMILTN